MRLPAPAPEIEIGHAAGRIVGTHALPAGHMPSLEALIDLYDAWGKPEKAAEYRALLRKAEEADDATE